MSSISRRVGSTLAIISALGLSSVALAAEPAPAANDAATSVEQPVNHTKEAAHKKMHHHHGHKHHDKKSAGKIEDRAPEAHQKADAAIKEPAAQPADAAASAPAGK